MVMTQSTQSLDHCLHATPSESARTPKTAYRAFSSTGLAQDLSGTLQGAGGVGGLAMLSLNGTNCFPCFDGNGNVMGLVKSADGTVVAEYEYSPFGECIEATGAMAQANPFRFSTKPTDDETGWYNFGHRSYSPLLGRFPTHDPLEEYGGINLYTFCCNNPLLGYEFLGLEWIIKRSSDSPWAVAHSTASEDTFQTLAKKVHLDHAERTKWIKWGDGFITETDEAKLGCRYGVPNVLGFYTSKHSMQDIPGTVVNNYRFLVEMLAKGFENDGFKVILKKNASSVKDFEDFWTLEGIYGVFYAGHGGLSVNVRSIHLPECGRIS